MGSATDQKIRPIPMPPLNSMAIQEVKANSGRSSSRPRRIWPKRLTIRYSSKPSTPLTRLR
ncbi:hypothetical protein D3C86_1872410 [compost metagenome]